MKRINTVLIALPTAALLLLGSCELVGPDPEAEPADLRPLSAAEKETVRSDNTFGFNMFSALQASEPDESLFISPLSVSMALGMTLNGASGETYEAMKTTLEKQGLSEKEINESYRKLIDLLTELDPRVVFEIANSIWYREGFQVEQSFLDVNRTYFDAEIRPLDFSRADAADIINGWIDEKTHGKIEEVIREVGADVVMYLINAIYFKGTWTYEFDEELTVDDRFTNADGTGSDVKMMYTTARLPYVDGDGYRAVDLPYGDSLYSMTLVLPDVSTDITNLARSLDTESWDALVAGFSPKEIQVQLPRFKLEYESSLVDALTALGMGVAFSDAADLSRIRSSGGLLIDDVIHKTFVEVNEEGTEAAAVTVVVIVETSVGGGPTVFRVDRPFIFAIRERHSGSIIFIGKVMGL